MTAVITGVGLVSPLGKCAQSTWQALLDGHSIYGHHSLKVEEKGPRVNSIALRAAREAIAKAGWNHLPDTAVIVGTSKGGVQEWMHGQVADDDCNFGLSTIAEIISREFKTEGPRLTLSAACASGLHAVIRATMMIQSAEVKRAIVVAAEASVHPLFLGSFQRLGVLAQEGDRCRPFDAKRTGFLMSETAAAICVESVDVSKNQKPYLAIDRFALGGDALHLTAGNPNGVTLQRLMRSVINKNQIDLIHAHGTGTVLNDAIEADAIDRVVPDDTQPAVYSHKGALGHSLGASGLVSVVINALAHQHGKVPGNVNSSSPIGLHKGIISDRTIDRRINRSVVCATGFGGPVAVVGFRLP